ncbi:MAG: 3-hydroxyacyl-[acyl-carrier-protein] dehydratase FabZ [Thermodesulfovibrionales bacterium]
MRFLYYDKIELINKGKDIVGIKTFSLSEEFLRKHFTKKPLIPGVIFIEAMAQLLGWLIIYTHDFKLSSIMTLIEGVRLTSDLRPGFKATIHGEIINTNKRDSLGRARITVDGNEIAVIDRIIYGHFHNVDTDMLKRWFHYYSGISVSEG